MKKGLFITIEGCEGSGKTTVSKRIIEKLKGEGFDVVYTREPGGSVIAEQIRKVLLDKANTAMDERTEALLFAASRRQHLVEVVMPALKENKIVICDRFIDSSLVYQGYARGLGIDKVYEINKFAIDDKLPDLTIYFDIDPQTGLSRLSNRSEINRLDVEVLNFHQKVHEGYEVLYQRYPERIKVVDASQSIDEVSNNTYKIIMDKVMQYV